MRLPPQSQLLQVHKSCAALPTMGEFRCQTAGGNGSWSSIRSRQRPRAEVPDCRPRQGRAEQAKLWYAEGWLGVWGFRDWDASETDDILNTTYTHLYTLTHTAAYNHTWLHTEGGQAGGRSRAGSKCYRKTKRLSCCTIFDMGPQTNAKQRANNRCSKGARAERRVPDHPVIWRTTCVRMYW